MIIRLIVIIGVLVAFWFVFSQIILPAWKDRQLFPMFRGIGEARRKLKEARDREVEARILQETAETATSAARVEVGTQQRIVEEYDKMYTTEENRQHQQQEKRRLYETTT